MWTNDFLYPQLTFYTPVEQMHIFHSLLKNVCNKKIAFIISTRDEMVRLNDKLQVITKRQTFFHNSVFNPKMRGESQGLDLEHILT